MAILFNTLFYFSFTYLAQTLLIPMINHIHSKKTVPKMVCLAALCIIDMGIKCGFPLIDFKDLTVRRTQSNNASCHPLLVYIVMFTLTIQHILIMAYMMPKGELRRKQNCIYM